MFPAEWTVKFSLLSSK